MRKIKFFFFSFFTALLLTVLLFVLVVNFCGRGVTDQPWVRHLYPLKTHFAKEQKSPKIIIIGGSSSLFGISGVQLKEYTGMDNINFSMSIMVPMRFYLTELENNVGEGDIVVLPLELGLQYCNTAEKNFSQFGLSLLFGSIPETQKTLSCRELCSLYFQYGFSWINTTLFHQDAPLMRCIQRQNREMQNIFSGVNREQFVYTQWKNFQTKEAKGKYGFFSDLSIHGDWQNDQPAKGTESRPYLLQSSVSDEFLFCYSRIKELTKKRRAALLLVWPNVYFYPEQTVFFEEFTNLLASKGITIYGRPEAMAFPQYFYFDPICHMNRHGATLWTYELAKTISQATGIPLKKRNQTWPYIVFADDPARSFPGVKPVQIYDTGVRIGQKTFPLVLDIPENLRGKDLELNLIALPEQKTGMVFSGIMTSGASCQITELRHLKRAEIFIRLPASCTGGKQIRLICSLCGDSIGMERVFMHEAPSVNTVLFQSGFSVPEPWGRWTDGERAELSVAIPQEFRKRDLKLNFDVYTFVHEKRPECKFRILTGDKVLYEGVSTQFNSNFILNIPAEYTGGTYLPLTIVIANPVSPKELGVSTDTRKLGIGIRNIRREPAP